MASSDYNPIFPTATAADDKIRTFVSEFYRTSDDPTKNDQWVDYFLPDAVIVMGPDTVRGVDEIRRLRQKMWEAVAARKHKPEKVFESSFESGSVAGKEYMLFGSLVYNLKTGEEQGVSWAGHAVVKEVEGQLKFSYYRVYIQR